MKYTRTTLFLTIIISCAIAVSLFAGAVIVDFRGEAGHNQVTLKWSTMSEINCNGFEIERSLDKIEFKKIHFIEGMGTESSEKKEYEYIDRNVYKSETNRTFYYRLKIVNSDGSSSIYSQIVSVAPSMSGARYTWGSIKAMFR